MKPQVKWGFIEQRRLKKKINENLQYHDIPNIWDDGDPPSIYFYFKEIIFLCVFF